MFEILNGKTLLVVDDVATIRTIIADVLGSNGVEVLEAESGERALEVASGRAIDAFLLDIRLAGINGLELCRALRAMARYRSAPIVFVTSMDEREMLQWALEAGCDDFIQKPIYPMVLRKRLSNLLEMASCRKRLGRAIAQSYGNANTSIGRPTPRRSN